MSRLDCPKQARCAGCPLGAEPYAEGLERKGRALSRAIEAFSDLAPAIAPPRAATPTLAYRQRAKLVCERRRLGLYERGTHHVLDISECRVLAPPLLQAAEALRRALPLPIYGADLRLTSEGVLLTLLIEAGRPRASLEAVARSLVDEGHVRSVAVSVRSVGNLRLLAGEPEALVGPVIARHRLSDDLPYGYAAPGSFVQAHAGQASYVQRAIVTGLEQRLGKLSEHRVLELFAGNGSLALLLSRHGARVTAVEAYAPALALAERAALEQCLQLEARAGDATRFLQAGPPVPYDAVIVNPPRRGLEPELRRALARSTRGALTYVSCNPQTLARDLWHLKRLGLDVTQIEPLDMIPWSDAVEALVWLTPAHAPAPRVLFEDERWLAVDKPPHEPPLLRDQQVAVDGFGAQLSGVAWLAKTADAAPGLSRALASAERELHLLVRGNLRKRGTVMRRRHAEAKPGIRYLKQSSVGRHSFVSAVSRDAEHGDALRDFADIGHPVLGDARYGDARSNLYFEHQHGLDRPFLHVSAVRLRSASGQELRVESELSPDLRQVLASGSSD